mmetsp:Transcript_8747/g.32553  ORF Transcript_8747/g.32553 Transcript_8747/m.32553 type:complete len:214 (-) Transcript_8747:747-1388(-)
MISIECLNNTGPMNKLMTMIATASVENAGPQYGKRAATVRANPSATPACVTCAIHSTLRRFSPVISLTLGAFNTRAATDVAQNNANKRTVTSPTAMTREFHTFSNFKLAPANVKKNKFTAGEIACTAARSSSRSASPVACLRFAAVTPAATHTKSGSNPKCSLAINVHAAPTHMHPTRTFFQRAMTDEGLSIRPRTRPDTYPAATAPRTRTSG